jgi:hypothetical protein
MKRLLAVLLMLLPMSVLAQGTVRYFGYFYDDANSSFQENYGHINLFNIQQMIIGADTADRDATTTYVLGQLAQAKAHGVRATINAAPYVFHWTDSTGSWSAEPNAAANWSTFINQLIVSGYIIPGRPDLSTVAAIYLIDEPDQNGFGDVDGAANPTLVSVVSVIRSNPSTSGIPLASILTTNFASNFSHGMTLLDWVGFDWYGSTQSQWTSRYNQLKSMLSANQRTIIVPKAALGASLGSGSYDDPNFFSNIFNTDAKVVWFAPFVWFSNASVTGTRDIPALKAAYIQIGGNIKAAGCSSSVPERSFCMGTTTKAAVVAAANLLLQ